MKKGFTLVELLISISLISILTTVSVIGYRGQILKANDGKKKTDLYKFQVALEDYYNDNNCYPEKEALASCGSNPGTLAGYLSSLPCQPGGDPYEYEPEAGTCPQYFRFFADLQNTADLAVVGSGCSAGCLAENNQTYNFGVSSSNVNLAETVSASPPAVVCDNYFGCVSGGCKALDGPEMCPNVHFCNDGCDGGCKDEDNILIESKRCQ